MRDFIIELLTKAGCFLKERWDGIVAPNETRACKQADALQKNVSAFCNIQKESRIEILFQYRMYREIGIPEEECRSKIKAMLEERSSHVMSKKEIIMFLKTTNRHDGK